MIYVISKATFGSYNVRDIQCNANWDCCPYSDYALIPDSMVEGILATKGYCDITLNSAGTEVASFTARTIPSVEEECCGTNTVLSVNGKTANTAGEVSLAASDVGARPSTWMPTAADVGAAPSGLVLQSFTANSNSEITEALTTVFNSMGNDTVGYCHIHVSTSGLDLYDTSWYIEIRRRNATYATVTAKSILNNYTMQRAFSGGNWQDWEWFNPPMVAGKEYRTAERYRAKVVYVQLVNLGSMPNKTVKNITFKPTNIADRISCELMMQLASSNHTETCPAVGTSISDIETMATWFGNNTDSVIRVATKYDRSSYTGFALCKYTKG